MQDNGILLIISGPSGSGKGTVVNSLLDKGGFALSISATTRKPRNYEKEGIHYFFKDKDEFIQMIDEDELIEHACFCDNYYGTPRAYVSQKLSEGTNVILEIEVQGALQIKEKHPEAVLVFMLPPTIEDLRSRLEGRGTETKEAIGQRINRAVEELELLSQYDYLVINDEVENAAVDIEQIVKNEKQRAFRNLDFVAKFKGEI